MASVKRRKGSKDTPPDRAAKRQRVPDTQGPSFAQVAKSDLTTVIVVQAADIWSRDWLVEKASGFRLREGLEVKIQGLEVMQRLLRATVLIPGIPEDLVAVLRHLEFKNPTLKTGNWRVYPCKKGSGPVGSGWIMAVTFPEGSIRALRALEESTLG